MADTLRMHSDVETIESAGSGEWVTLKEAAALAGVAVKTWELWAKAGRVHEGVWGRRPTGQRCRLWPIEAARGAKAPVAGDGEWIGADEVIALLNTTHKTWRQQVSDGTVPAGVMGKSERGNACWLWRAEVIQNLRAEKEAARAQPFPPIGWVDREGAARHLQIGTATLSLWATQGRLTYNGMLKPGPNGVPCRIYEIAELDRAREAMKAAEEEQAQPPEGFVDFNGAAAFFGQHPVVITKWQREGKLGRGTWIKTTGKQRRYLFAIADLEAARQRLREAASRPAAPEGFIAHADVCERLKVSQGTVRRWELENELSEGRWVPIPGTSSRTKIYPIAEIERLEAKIAEAKRNFPPPGWVEMKEAAQRAHVSVEVWKNWLADGRVEQWRWARRPTMARCKLFSIEAIDRLVEEAGSDHLFYLEPDGHGGWKPPEGYVTREGAAEIFGVAHRTFNSWQTDGRITCGRWARVPADQASIGVNGRRVYPIEELRRLAVEFDKVGKPYIDPNDPSIARVPIMSWSKTRFEAIIDAADLPLIEGMRWNWMPRSSGEDAMVVRSAVAGEQTPLRRILLGIEGKEHNLCHRNGDPLDCRRDNLVVKTHGEKSYGQRKRRTTAGGQPCTSRFKGVCWIGKGGRWRAQIQKEGQCHRLGNFDDEIAAAEAYDEAARELFGEFARLNFPDGIDARLERELAA